MRNRGALLGSVMLIILASVLVGAGTTAWFYDVETSEGNMLTAGIIDLSVNGENPLISTLVTLEDMKPCQEFLVVKLIHVENNPYDFYLVIYDIAFGGGVLTEPEAEAEAGVPFDDLSVVIFYDLAIFLDDGTVPGELDDMDTLIDVVIPLDFDLGPSLSDLEEVSILVAEGLEPCTNYLVVQSFHMHPEAENEFQGDWCSFTEDFIAVQVGAP